MTKDAKPTPFGRSGLEWSYGNERFERDRRVTVFPYEMLGDILFLSAEARGLLLTVFCRYWPFNAPVIAEELRVEHRLTKRRFARLLAEMVASKVVDVRGDKITPGRSFGANTSDAPLRTPKAGREVPSDWLAKREFVFARDGYACVYCGSGGLELHCDHVHPVAKGGGHEVENLVAACSVCNLAKGSKTVAEWRPDLVGIFAR